MEGRGGALQTGCNVLAQCLDKCRQAKNGRITQLNVQNKKLIPRRVKKKADSINAEQLLLAAEKGDAHLLKEMKNINCKK